MFWSFLIILFIGVDYCFGSFFEFEKEVHPDDIYNQNQIYLNRKERFIKFDTKDNELEIEFGISVPFMKIPLATGPEYKHGGGDLGGLGHGHGLPHEHEEKEDKRISINGPGLIVAGMLMLTSFLIIPFLFAKTNEGFGFRRMASEDNAFWRVVKEVDDVLSYNQIDSSTCGQKAMCWIAKTSKGGKDGSIGKWIESLLSTWWVSRLIDGTFVDDAVSAGYGNETCSMKYPQCPISQNHLKLAATTFMSGFSKR